MIVDEVSIPYLILFRHRGVRVGYWDGSCIVYACSPNGGVVRQRLEDFAAGYAVTATSAKTRLTPQQVMARAESMLGRKYDRTNWTCDHFVAYALGNKVESPQLRFAAALGLLALMLAGLSRS